MVAERLCESTINETEMADSLTDGWHGVKRGWRKVGGARRRGTGPADRSGEFLILSFLSFPSSAWECRSRSSASQPCTRRSRHPPVGKRSFPTCVPKQSLATREGDEGA